MTDSDSELVLRRATDDDWPAIIAADARAFAFIHPLDAEAEADIRSKLRDGDVVVVYDESGPVGPVLAGVAMFYRMTLTLPGGARVDLPGLSWVSVAATKFIGIPTTPIPSGSSTTGTDAGANDATWNDTPWSFTPRRRTSTVPRAVSSSATRFTTFVRALTSPP